MKVVKNADGSFGIEGLDEMIPGGFEKDVLEEVLAGAGMDADESGAGNGDEGDAGGGPEDADESGAGNGDEGDAGGEPGGRKATDERRGVQGRMVPLAALHEEREKRRELQQRLAALEQRVSRDQERGPAPTPMEQSHAVRAAAAQTKILASQMLGVTPDDFDPVGNQEHMVALVSVLSGGIANAFQGQMQQQFQAYSTQERQHRVLRELESLAVETGEPDMDGFVRFAQTGYLDTLPFREGRRVLEAIRTWDADVLVPHIRKAHEAWRKGTNTGGKPDGGSKKEQGMGAENNPAQEQRRGPRSGGVSGAGGRTLNLNDLENLSPEQFARLSPDVQRKLLGG